MIIDLVFACFFSYVTNKDVKRMIESYGSIKEEDEITKFVKRDIHYIIKC